MRAFGKRIVIAFVSTFLLCTLSLQTTLAFTLFHPISLHQITATQSPLFVLSNDTNQDNMWPSVPAQNSHHPVRTMMRGWLSMMIPMAWTCWRRTHSIPATIGAFFFAPFLAVTQGIIGIVRYRIFYGDAPLPHSPAHGVVVVSPNSTNTAMTMSSCSRSASDEQHITGCACLGGRRWRNTTLLSQEERQLLNRALQEQPLRLLVIGDSLAIGVGTSMSCTPLLPEVIARTLSKAHGGRAVYWTCHGAPGASAGWIVRELERGASSRQQPWALSQSSTVTTLSDDSSESDEDDLPKEWQEWRDRLHIHKKRFDPDVLGPYDICVVLTGSNDLKSAFFPFLLRGEDRLFRQEARERGGNYANELRRVLDVLQRRMKEGMDEIRENILERLQPNSPRTARLHSKDTTTTTTEGKDTTTTTSTNTEKKPVQHKRGPLIVLPGMPARALPIFRTIPLRWFAVPIVDIMDNHKRALAKSHAGEVMFVEAPTIEGITEFEEQRGAIWKQREREDTLLALRDIHRSQCLRIETDMKEYYARKGQEQVHHHWPRSCLEIMPQHNAPVPPLSERPGKAGSKIFSVDNVHPNDEGYDFWGRYIATAIVEELKRRDGQ